MLKQQLFSIMRTIETVFNKHYLTVLIEEYLSDDQEKYFIDKVEYDKIDVNGQRTVYGD